jgi:hypothetical protein
MTARAAVGVAAVAAGLLVASARSAAAQSVDGYVSLTGDVFPSVRQEQGTQTAFAELRAKLFSEYARDLGDRWKLTLAGVAEGLVAERGRPEIVRDAVLQPVEAHLEARWLRADLRLGVSRIVWGRLDEIQPTDVVNPLDLTRFFFEGRSEARRAVPLVRARWLPADSLSLEAIYVPWFRRGRFDELDDETSAFNLTPATTCAVAAEPPCVELPRVSNEPAHVLTNAQGGARLNVTSGRVDWSVSAYRGFEPLPLFEILALPMPDAVPVVVERFPRFTMVGGDFETVRGEWGVRGEIAAFVDRSLQSLDQPIVLDGRTVEGGIGIDRSAGLFRVSGNVLVARRWLADSQPVAPGDSAAIDRTDVSMVGSIDRTFSRETRRLRAFAVYNPGERSGFGRVIATVSLRDNVAVEASAGLFVGEGLDVLSRLSSRDFVYLRLKVFY